VCGSFWVSEEVERIIEEEEGWEVKEKLIVVCRFLWSFCDVVDFVVLLIFLFVI